MQKINFCDISPFVRYSKTLILPPDFSTADVHACDNRVIYVCSGTVKIKLDDKSYTATRGAFFMFSSYTKYSIVNISQADAKIMSINFDYTESVGRSVNPIPTVSEKNWDASLALENIRFEDEPLLNYPVYIESMQMLEFLFVDMTEEFVNTKAFNNKMLSLLMHQVLIKVTRRINSGHGQKLTGLVERVIDYIQQNYACDLSNEKIGKHFSYHPNYINRVIQKHTGQSLHQYVLSCRVSKALELLQTSGLSVTEIAERVGFSSIKHFSQTFKSVYGYSPIHFKE